MNHLQLKKRCQSIASKYSSRIAPYDGSDEDIPFTNGEKKYFVYYSENGEQRLIDIHIQKPNGDDICIKQDLSHLLEDGDTLSFGALIC